MKLPDLTSAAGVRPPAMMPYCPTPAPSMPVISQKVSQPPTVEPPPQTVIPIVDTVEAESGATLSPAKISGQTVSEPKITTTTSWFTVLWGKVLTLFKMVWDHPWFVRRYGRFVLAVVVLSVAIVVTVRSCVGL